MDKRLLAILIVVGGGFSLAKGWGAIFTFPFWLVASPVLWYELREFSEIKTKMTISSLDKSLFYLLPLAYILNLVCSVGFGDTQDVLVFGVFNADSTGSLDELSQKIADTAFWVFAVLAIYMAYWLFKSRRELKIRKPRNILFWFSFTGLCLIVFSLLRS